LFSLKKKMEEIRERFSQVNQQLSDPKMLQDIEKYTALSKEHATLREITVQIDRWQELSEECQSLKEVIASGDPELEEMARSELEEAHLNQQKLERKITRLLVPADPADKNNAILEIRAGTGGEEAALFAGEIFRMYSRYADAKGWKTEILDESPTDLGGIKEIVARVQGEGVYGVLKFEAGVHRVQRVPATEAGGRVHTSSATVVVLPEISHDIQVDIDPDDLKIDVYRASGAGGQHVNRTESAVRITHLPSGIVVTCQNERSQHQNRAQAMGVLKSKLYERQRLEKESKLSSQRKSLIGSGDRSEKIRTYNYPQNRLTDHRIHFTSYRLGDFLEGDLDELLEALMEEETAQKVAEA